MTQHELEQMVKTLVEENQRLQQRIAELERELAKARKTSRTSSKPPSSDVAPPRKRHLRLHLFLVLAIPGANPDIPNTNAPSFPRRSLRGRWSTPYHPVLSVEVS